jgi:hypothetical protein
MPGKKLAGVTPDKMKSNESERKAQGLAEKGAQGIQSVDTQFKKMTKVLTSLNKNVETLRNIEMAQLAADYHSRGKGKKRDESRDKILNNSAAANQSTGVWMVEANARNEAGLREISKRITMLHGWMAGDSAAQTATRLSIASLEHTDAIKKHRSIGMAQLKILKEFKIDNIAGLAKDFSQVGSDGKTYDRRAILDLWDQRSTEKKETRDSAAVRKSMDDEGPRKAHMIRSIDETVGKAGREFLVDAKRQELIDKKREKDPKWQYSKDDKYFSDTVEGEVYKELFKATSTIVDFGKSFGGFGTGSGGGSGSNLIGSNTRFADDTVRLDLNPEILKKYLKNLGPIAADTNAIKKMMKKATGLSSTEEAREARKALRRHQAFAGPQKPLNGSASGGGGGGMMNIITGGVLGSALTMAAVKGYVMNALKFVGRKVPYLMIPFVVYDTWQNVQKGQPIITAFKNAVVSVATLGMVDKAFDGALGGMNAQEKSQAAARIAIDKQKIIEHNKQYNPVITPMGVDPVDKTYKPKSQFIIPGSSQYMNNKLNVIKTIQPNFQQIKKNLNIDTINSTQAVIPTDSSSTTTQPVVIKADDNSVKTETQIINNYNKGDNRNTRLNARKARSGQ